MILFGLILRFERICLHIFSTFYIQDKEKDAKEINVAQVIWIVLIDALAYIGEKTNGNHILIKILAYRFYSLRLENVRK